MDSAPLKTSSEEAVAAAPPTTKPKKPVRRIIRRKKDKKKEDDADVVDPKLLEKAMLESCLPKAYSFEIVKTLKRINQILT